MQAETHVAGLSENAISTFCAPHEAQAWEIGTETRNEAIFNTENGFLVVSDKVFWYVDFCYILYENAVLPYLNFIDEIPEKK